MREVISVELNMGDIAVSSAGVIYKVKGMHFGSVEYGYITLTLNPLLESGRWSKREVVSSFHNDSKFKVASSKNEARQIAKQLKEEVEEMLPFFVYGTLRRDCGNYHYFQGRTVAEMPAKVKGLLWHMGSVIPYMTEGDGVVHGELMVVDSDRYAETLRRVDGLEGYTKGASWNHYDRKKVVATLEDGSQVEAWAYFYADNGYKYAHSQLMPIKGGDYKRWSNHREFTWRRVRV